MRWCLVRGWSRRCRGGCGRLVGIGRRSAGGVGRVVVPREGWLLGWGLAVGVASGVLWQRGAVRVGWVVERVGSLRGSAPRILGRTPHRRSR